MHKSLHIFIHYDPLQIKMASTTTASASANILFPPTPPLDHKYKKGNFDYIEDPNTREMITTAFQAIDLLELWDYMKLETVSYMLSEDANVRLIYNKIEELGYWGHSGFSFGWTLRTLQKIARIGEKAFMIEWTTPKPK